MESQYEELFKAILDEDTPNPTIVLLNKDHMNRIRAGLNRCKKDYNKLLKLLDEESLDNTTFRYKEDKNDPTKITISLEKIEPTSFEIL